METSIGKQLKLIAGDYTDAHFIDYCVDNLDYNRFPSNQLSLVEQGCLSKFSISPDARIIVPAALISLKTEAPGKGCSHTPTKSMRLAAKSGCGDVVGSGVEAGAEAGIGVILI